eukprot:3369685-Rhodomonas_salina.1
MGNVSSVSPGRSLPTAQTPVTLAQRKKAASPWRRLAVSCDKCSKIIRFQRTPISPCTRYAISGTDALYLARPGDLYLPVRNCGFSAGSDICSECHASAQSQGVSLHPFKQSSELEPMFSTPDPDGLKSKTLKGTLSACLHAFRKRPLLCFAHRELRPTPESVSYAGQLHPSAMQCAVLTSRMVRPALHQRALSVQSGVTQLILLQPGARTCVWMEDQDQAEDLLVWMAACALSSITIVTLNAALADASPAETAWALLSEDETKLAVLQWEFVQTVVETLGALGATRGAVRDIVVIGDVDELGLALSPLVEGWAGDDDRRADTSIEVSAPCCLHLLVLRGCLNAVFGLHTLPSSAELTEVCGAQVLRCADGMAVINFQSAASGKWQVCVHAMAKLERVGRARRWLPLAQVPHLQTHTRCALLRQSLDHVSRRDHLAVPRLSPRFSHPLLSSLALVRLFQLDHAVSSQLDADSSLLLDLFTSTSIMSPQLASPSYLPGRPR